MLSFIRMRCQGCRLACELSRSLQNDYRTWIVSPLPTQSLVGAQVERGEIKIVITPSPKCPCQRMCDDVRLLVDGADVFLPLLSRIRLRNAARVRVQRFAATKIQ